MAVNRNRNGKKMAKKTLVMDDKIVDRVQAEAEKDRRSFTAQVSIMLEEALEARGRK